MPSPARVSEVGPYFLLHVLELAYKVPEAGERFISVPAYTFGSTHTTSTLEDQSDTAHVLYRAIDENRPQLRQLWNELRFAHEGEADWPSGWQPTVFDVNLWAFNERHVEGRRLLVQFLEKLLSWWREAQIHRHSDEAATPDTPVGDSDVRWADLTDREQSILRILDGHRMTAKQIAREMKRSRVEVEEDHLKRALAGLRRRRILGNRRSSGYFIERRPRGMPTSEGGQVAPTR